MKHYFLLCCILLAQGLFGQTQPPTYASVRISLRDKQMADLVKTGIETEHGLYYPGRSITVVLSSLELEKVKAAGFDTEVLIPDLTAHYLEQSRNPTSVVGRDNGCNPDVIDEQNYQTPVNYSYGSMGGYLTYEQMMAELDEMRVQYPDLITARMDASDTIETWDGHKIQLVKISDNPDADEPEREVLYTSLHHAREPNSASQMIFFMWYLLENYATRPDIKAIVDNLEMYFVPCINPDGYIYNQTTNPNGGGFWRKNRRNNGDGTFGVDLNRNYGHFWGDLGGSSGETSSEIYRGPTAFSEPETRTMRDLCLAHDFLFVLNYHTSGNLLIYPWAYSDDPADPAFIEYGKLLTRENLYRYGTASETVGYNVNGSSDDWMLAEAGAYSFTPEVGNTGFWPAFDQIDGFNKDNLWQNLVTAYSALRYGEAVEQSGVQMNGTVGTIPITLMRYGLLDGPITVTLTPLSPQILSPAASKSYEPAHLAQETQLFDYQLIQGVALGTELNFLIETDNGFWIETDTLKKVFGATTAGVVNTVFQDPLDDLQQWSGNWALTGETFYSAPSCFTDSPNAPYAPNSAAISELVNTLSIPADATSANLRFWAKWVIEDDWDYTQVSAIDVAGGITYPLCGMFTQPGSNTQPIDEPVFDGNQPEWVEECMSLNELIGKTIGIRFKFAADGFIEEDGFYFDDVRVEYTLPVSGVQVVSLGQFQLWQNEPNPTAGQTLIRWDNQGQAPAADAQLKVWDALGVLVIQQSVQSASNGQFKLDTRSLRPGVYHYAVSSTSGQTPALKMVVVR